MSLFKLNDYNGFLYLTSDLLDRYNIKHLFSTIKDNKRNLNNGVNFGFSDSFSKEETLKNYEIVAEILGAPINNITKSTQVHDDLIFTVNKEHLGMGITKETKIESADGLFTDIEYAPLCIFTADCVPILLTDKKNSVVCAVHSGWRGTAKKIVKNAVKLFHDCNINAEDIICAVGPSISSCCYEVSEDVINEMNKEISDISSYYIETQNNKYYLDLKGINKKILLDCGVPESNIDICLRCTKCDNGLFYSYRRDVNAGRMAAFIQIGG